MQPEQLQPSYFLASYTMPAPGMVEKGVTTPLELIAYCARVSNPKNQLNHKTAGKLIRSLIARKEWSPLEMVDVTFGLTTARDISRQQLRHRSGSFQEFSQRYAEVEENRHCLRELRYQHPTDRQSSIPADPIRDAEDLAWWIDAQTLVIQTAQDVYQEARRRNVAKEVARVVLPEGLTLTDLFFKASLRTWVHYLDLRGGNGTQLEHQQIALGLAQAITAVFPMQMLEEKP